MRSRGKTGKAAEEMIGTRLLYEGSRPKGDHAKDRRRL
jgi:hypothetical protein